MYIGCHKTKNLDDGYLGSGKILKRAIKKYGIENFIKEILFVFNTSEEVFDKEKEIVNKLFVESDNTYNILIGGWGGYDYINSTGKNLYGKNGQDGCGKQNLLDGKKLRKLLIERGTYDKWRKNMSQTFIKKYSLTPFHWLGRKHKEETKRKIGEKNSVNHTGKSNPQYGKCWVYSDIEKRNKCVPKENLLFYLNTDWKQGRKMNFMGGV